MKRFVFVYGTLMRRQRAHWLLVGVSTYVGKATIVGTLYSMGAYPAFQSKGADIVHGELYVVDDATMAALDMYEGYREPPEDGLYDKEVVEVKIEGQSVRATVYTMKDAMLNAHWHARIPSGSWREYVEAAEERRGKAHAEGGA